MPKTKKADVPRNVREALERVLQYNWDDELRDLTENPPDDGTTHGHIFEALVTLDNWLNNRNATTETYIAERRHGVDKKT
jgi:hypothetical protein